MQMKCAVRQCHGWAKLSSCKAVLAPGCAAEPQCWLPACLLLSRDPGRVWGCRESRCLGQWTTWREPGFFSHLWSFLHSQGNCFGKLNHDPKSWGMLKILATGQKKAYVPIHLFWKDSVQNTEKTRVIPIDLAGFEWNSKCLALNSSEAWASETGEEFSGNRLVFPQLPISSCLCFFSPALPLHPAWLGQLRVRPFLSGPLHIDLFLSFSTFHTGGVSDWDLNTPLGSLPERHDTVFSAGLFSDTLFQTHPVPIATLGNNWDALHYFFHSSGTRV